jgi:hypothetical protein
VLVISFHGPFLIVQHNPETTNNGTEDVEGRTEHRVAAAPIVETQEKQNQVTTLVKHSNNHDRFGHQIEDNIIVILSELAHYRSIVELAILPSRGEDRRLHILEVFPILPISIRLPSAENWKSFLLKH